MNKQQHFIKWKQGNGRSFTNTLLFLLLPILILIGSIVFIIFLPTYLLTLYAKKQLARKYSAQQPLIEGTAFVTIFIALIFVNLFAFVNGISLLMHYYKYSYPPYQQNGIPITGEIIHERRANAKGLRENYVIQFSLHGQTYQIRESSIANSVSHDSYGLGDKIDLVVLEENPQRYAVFKSELEQLALQQHHQSFLAWELGLMAVLTVLFIWQVQQKKRPLPTISN